MNFVPSARFIALTWLLFLTTSRSVDARFETKTVGCDRITTTTTELVGDLETLRSAVREINVEQVHVPNIRGGVTGAGKTYQNVKNLWDEVLTSGGTSDIYDKEKGWYGQMQHFWANEQPTVKGVTGTTDANSAADLRESKVFLRGLQTIKNIRPGVDRALDCGCGIGRLSENILAKRFKTVDLIDPSPQMLSTAMKALEKFDTNITKKVGKVFNTSIELVQLPMEPTYDFIVLQWVSMYLTDNDLVAFLKQCKRALKNRTAANVAGSDSPTSAPTSNTSTNRTGLIFVKENIMHQESFLVGQDRSINRCANHYKELFKLAGLTIIAEEAQKEWPNTLLPLRMYALH